MDETNRSDGRRIWRSLERPYDSEDLPEDLRPEFPEGADTPPDGVTRRTMMGLMGASLAMAGWTGCRRPVEHIVPYADPPPEIVPGVPERYATTLPMGTSAGGVVVESHEGRPGKIEGNELHPVSRGAASAWTQAEILRLYDPDRSRSVLHRTPTEGPGGDEGGQEISWVEEGATWDDFVTFWGGIAGSLDETGGEGLAVLLEPWSSPTVSRMVESVRGRFPDARIVAWSPWSEENVFTGLRRATGRDVRPLYRFENARTILTLDADPLMTEGDAVAHARGFAEARRPGADMARLWSVEPTPTVTGAAADHRVRLESGRLPAFVAALAAELDVPGAIDGQAADLPEDVASRLPEIARELRAAGSQALLVAGWRQPPAVHAAVHAIHQTLGAVGSTVELQPLRDVGWGRTEDLTALAEAMHGGEISSLFVLGGNPVYDAPADLRFAGAMDQVEATVHLSTHVDETSQHARWHLHRTHPFEAWGDARAADGTPSVIQPLIAPLFDGATSDAELLSFLALDSRTPGFELVRTTWGVTYGLLEEDTWERVLHDGVAPADLSGPVGRARGVGDAAETGGGETTTASGTFPELVTAPTNGDGLELVLAPSAAVFDGRYANVAWLQEMPDPLTKLTWGNAALVSPATARELGVESGDVVSMAPLAETSALVPVLVQPGQADGTVTLALGYGRTAAGRVGTGVGVNAHKLRTAAAPWVVPGTSVTAHGGSEDLARTQEHWSMEGRELVHEMGGEMPKAGTVTASTRTTTRRPVCGPFRSSTGPTSGACPSTCRPASAATPVWWPARARTTCRWWARSRCSTAARCTGCGWTATTWGRRTTPGWSSSPCPASTARTLPASRSVRWRRRSTTPRA